ncbi:class I SAM-dependent DNA methyltransferase [Salinarimonas rosea]|uniref:class I SAM-dependent DNA methyltransferase n=1 Tax=Salinarimonas rosea TaxID=552063 RepID=UPI0004193933|nr:class I SAM-dependent DNA methyltransferase [Salinarimonas rosea]
MTPREFIAKWSAATLTERQAAQEHFIDLCRLVDHPTPAAGDATGEAYAFEKGAAKTGGGEGFADVWKRGFFAWEYKKKKRNLDAAMDQLVRYAAALENPPLQVACDIDRIRIRTAWTNLVATSIEIALEDLEDPAKLALVHAVFHDPDRLRPERTRERVTREAADKFSALALRLQGRADPEAVAHFVNQLVFCFFASSVKLLPEGMFQALIARAQKRPKRAKGNLDELFAEMRTGGEFALQDIAHFNGGLFDGQEALDLDQGDADLLMQAARLDWSEIDPTIFGTLFERFLDPGKRAQIGAHYTDPGKIMMIVEPVVLRPLRREWEAARGRISAIMEKATAKAEGLVPSRRGAVLAKARGEAEAIQLAFLERLRGLTVLDPACGSGNFLYLALQAVKDLEWRAIQEGEGLGLSPRAPEVGPEILRGIEINPLAAELARTTIWIGDIQWRIRNAIYTRPDPILRKLDTVECRDALITRREDGSVVEAGWPAAEFIVGNPPFLGGKKLIAGLGAEETETIREVYAGRMSPFSDLVCWWFDKARKQIEDGRSKRAGLVATNSIRGGRNRLTLEAIQHRLKIFEAWSDEPWIVDGASVRVSLVCFADDPPDEPMLDGLAVAAINPDLTADLPITIARRLGENADVSFIGIQKSGPLDVPGAVARRLLKEPLNVNGRPNSDVLSPWWIGIDVTRRPRDYWIINFNGLDEGAAARFEAPFEVLRREIEMYEAERGRKITRADYWRLWRSRPELFGALA